MVFCSCFDLSSDRKKARRVPIGKQFKTLNLLTEPQRCHCANTRQLTKFRHGSAWEEAVVSNLRLELGLRLHWAREGQKDAEDSEVGEWADRLHIVRTDGCGTGDCTEQTLSRRARGDPDCRGSERPDARRSRRRPGSRTLRSGRHRAQE